MKIFDKLLYNSNKKETLAWIFYDFGSSAYSLLIMSFAFPIYFKQLLAGGGNKGDLIWGITVSLSIFMGGIAAPILGSIADADNHKKRKFVIFALLGIVGTALLYFTNSNFLILSALLFIATNFLYEQASVLYDSFLYNVANEKIIGRISGFGWAMGYVGEILVLFLLKPFYQGGFYGENLNTYKLTFPLTALFYFIFALPAFIFLKDSKTKRSLVKISVKIRNAFKNVLITIKDLKKYKNIGYYIISTFFISDAVVTIIAFTPIFANNTVGLDLAVISKYMILTQIIAFPFTILAGWLSDHFGQKKILYFSIALWATIIVLLATVRTEFGYLIMSVVLGIVIGSSPAVGRSLMTKLVPNEKRTEFFGFNAFASKISATSGPITFGLVSFLTGSQRLAMLSLLIYFAIGTYFFSKVKA